MKVNDLVRVNGRGLHIITEWSGWFVIVTGFPENQVFRHEEIEVINEGR
jgi:hypothetical protein